SDALEDARHVLANASAAHGHRKLLSVGRERFDAGNQFRRGRTDRGERARLGLEIGRHLRNVAQGGYVKGDQSETSEHGGGSFARGEGCDSKSGAGLPLVVGGVLAVGGG